MKLKSYLLALSFSFSSYANNCPEYVKIKFNLGVDCPVSLDFTPHITNFMSASFNCTYSPDNENTQKKYSIQCSSTGCHDGWCSVFYPEYKTINYTCSLELDSQIEHTECDFTGQYS